ATRAINHHVVDALHNDLVLEPKRAFDNLFESRALLEFDFRRSVGRQQFRDQVAWKHLSISNGRKQIIGTRDSVVRRDAVEISVRKNLLSVQSESVGFLLEQLLAKLDCRCALAFGEIMTNLRSRSRRLDEVHPVARRMRRGRRHDFHDVSVSKLRPQRDYSPVDFRAGAGEPDLRVYGEGEVDWRRAARKLDDFSLGCEAVDFFGIEIEFERVEEFARVLDLLLPLDQPLEPYERFVFIRVRAAPPFFVFPVRGNA